MGVERRIHAPGRSPHVVCHRVSCSVTFARMRRRTRSTISCSYVVAPSSSRSWYAWCDQDLDAARATNRELMAQINGRSPRRNTR
jgi:hypothetical protein